MQVHAVPDAERAYDSTGRQLPWAYEYAESDYNQRRPPQESGPFGKARKRGTSRSRTPGTNYKKEDQAKLDNQRAIDDIFGRFKSTIKEKESLRTSRQSIAPPAPLPFSASTSVPNFSGLTGANNFGVGPAPGATGAQTAKEPTEVLLYGFGNDVQWAAIDFFEKVSQGIIYEGYDRNPLNSKWNLSLSVSRASSIRGLPKSAIQRVNEYVGGEHWIKVTFDSPEAAERACHYSPHIIQGYQVYAERYRGTGPNQDIAIRATAGTTSSSVAASPQTSHTVSSMTLQAGGSTTSTTVSSATATNSVPASTMPSRSKSMPFLPATFPETPQPSHTVDIAHPSNNTTAAATTTSSQTLSRSRSTLRVRGAKPAVLLPPEAAFLPAAPRWQQTLSSFPIIGWVVGSGHGIIGDAVPRKEDGSFDEAAASVYWRFWYMVDGCFGTDFCGVRGSEDDD
ncbi:hypothetical protein GQ43DRAFT_424876 [Delitschia confertaspora ATCC 74209]|uniref:Uncharacterized protein n=1 Tax=Delitschia confertaspora ATCC 74209 TaxID=1513339 RepID=A0A9P4JFE6_9PLEO|nr:hypothetical protein GQ43DRAFT_424876 [Delitschia confertaspora ATCC 74209]